jgi:hypothetical protein
MGIRINLYSYKFVSGGRARLVYSFKQI